MPRNQWVVPLNDQGGTLPHGAAPNPYNGTLQFGFASKHDGQLYFNATNGGNDPTPSNPLVSHYAPLQQLQSDLAGNAVAHYNLITPDLYNDMYSALRGGFTYQGVHHTGDQAAVAQGDHFLSKLLPRIMASDAYKNNGMIVIWFDETEGGDGDLFTLAHVVISPLARGNAYRSTVPMTHSSDLITLQELFGVRSPGGSFLGDANSPGTNDLSDMLKPGAIVPVP